MEDLLEELEPSARVELLRRQFLQLRDPRELDTPPLEMIKDPTCQGELYERMFRNGSVPYPPPARYRLRVLKLLMEHIEHAVSDSEEDEISDDLMACLTELMSLPSTSNSLDAQQRSYVTYTRPMSLDQPGNDMRTHTVTLLESPAVLASSGTTGFRTWEAALHLGSFLACPEGVPFVDGKNILELGAGSGLVSILCAKLLNAAHVVATDGDCEVLESLSSNIVLNGLKESGSISPRILRWGTWDNDNLLDGEGVGRHFDLLLGADVTYDHDSLLPLVLTVNELFERYNAGKMLLSATVRNPRTVETFLETCQAHSLTIEELFPEQSGPTKFQTGFFHSTKTDIRLLLITRCAN